MEKSSNDGDHIEITIGSKAKLVAAGKNVLQQIIYQELHQPGLPLYKKLTEPFWGALAWRRYARYLARSLATLEGVDREFSELFAFLSPLDLPVRMEAGEYKLSTIVESLALRRVIVLGEAGSGKTTSLRHLAMRQARLYAKGKATHIPIFGSLASFTGSDVLSFLFDKVIGYSSEETNYLLPSYLSRGRMIIFFDALNEMPGDEFSDNIRLLREFIYKYPLNRYVFSCRLENYRGELELPRAVIQPLSNQIIRAFIDGYLGEEGHKVYQQLEDTGLLQMVRSPLLLWMVIKTRNVPDSVGQLIERFVETLVEREYAKGEVQRKYLVLAEQTFYSALQRLAFVMMDKYRTTVIAKGEIDSILSGMNLQDRGEGLLSQGIDALLLRYSDERKRNFGFWHQIIQEYFAALSLERRYLDLTNAQLEALCNDPWWWETLVLLGDILPDNLQYLNRILDIPPNIQRVLLAAAIFHRIQVVDERYEMRIFAELLQVIEQSDLASLQATVNSLSRVTGKKFLFRLGKLLPMQKAEIQTKVVKLLASLGGTEVVTLLLAGLREEENKKLWYRPLSEV